jgi:plastocyanin
MTDQLTDERPAPPAEQGPRARQSLVLPIALPLITLAIIVLVLFGFSRVLLSTSAHAATFVALIVAITIMVVAITVASRERLSNGSLISMVVAIGGIAMLAGGVAIVAIGTGKKEEPAPLVVALAAPEGAAVSGFAETALQFKAGQPSSIEFDNQDPGVPHNMVIFAEDPAKNPQAPALFTGEKVTGPAKITYAVPALDAGTYFFHCEVHPTTMTGTIEAGAGPGALTVVAEGLAFNTKEIDLVAGQPTKLLFENKDAGTPHNIAIYDDSSKSVTLFQGEQFPGVDTRTYDIPAIDEGTYYFQCDVHPVMNGSVVVGPAGGAPSSSPSG